MGRLPGGRDYCLATGGWSWALSPWWAGPCQGVCLGSSCGLMKTLQLFCCWVRHPSMEPTGCWMGQVSGVKQWLLEWFTPMSIWPCHQFLCLHSEPQPHPAPGGDRSKASVGLAQAPRSSCSFLGSQCTTGQCAFQELEFLFLSILWCSCDQVLLTSKAKCSRGSSSWWHTLTQGGLRGLRIPTGVGELWYNYFQFVGHPISRYEILLYYKWTPTVSLYLLFLL